MERIAIIGSGYVGLVTGACLADFGIDVTCVDKNIEKIELLNKGGMPIYEPGLEEYIKRNMYYKRLRFTTDISSSVAENDIIFIAVGTPPLEDGSADLQYVIQVAKEIASNMNSYKIIVNKSTVPVGTGQYLKKVIQAILSERKVNYDFDVASNPEFLREGTAVKDFTKTDRVVIGTESKKAIEKLKEIYKILFLNNIPFVITNNETAELIKYASNAFLATKISFINELTEMCEKTGADIKQVSIGIGLDRRIGPNFLQAGPGYGGSCFPKDTQALVSIAEKNGCDLSIVASVIKANKNQKLRMVEKIERAMGCIQDKTFGILGLSFKPETDDMREAPSITIINELYKKGGNFKVYDPQALKEAKLRLANISDRITYCENEYSAAKDSDGLIIITDWSQFEALDLNLIKECMKGSYLFDLRNIYNPLEVTKLGFQYIGVGRNELADC